MSFVILCVYRHPSGKKECFIRDLEASLAKLPRGKIPIFISDSNIDLLKFDKIESHMNYASLLFAKGFLPYTTYPTRITPHSATLLDQIFIKSPKQELKIQSGIFYCGISDHLPCYISIKCTNATFKASRPKVRLYGEKQCTNFVTRMSAYPWQSIYTENSDWYQNFMTVVINFNIHFVVSDSYTPTQMQQR